MNMNFSNTNQTLNGSFNISNGTKVDSGGQEWNNIKITSIVNTLNSSLNTSGNGTDLDMPGPESATVELMQNTWAVIGILFSLIGLHTNIVMLSVIISEIRAGVWVSTNILLSNICILDTCICCVLLWEGILIGDSYEIFWPHCSIFCYQVNIIASILPPTRQTFALTLAISHFIFCTKSDEQVARWCAARNFIFIAVLLWVVTLGVITSMILAPRDLAIEVVSTCSTEFPYRHCHLEQNGYTVKVTGRITQIIFNVIPVALIVILSALTHWKLEQIYNDINAGNEIAAPAPVLIASRVLVRMAIVYSVLALPCVAWQVCNLMKVTMPPVLYIAFRFTLQVASVVNPVLYGSEKNLFIKRYCLLPNGSVVDTPIGY